MFDFELKLIARGNKSFQQLDIVGLVRSFATVDVLNLESLSCTLLEVVVNDSTSCSLLGPSDHMTYLIPSTFSSPLRNGQPCETIHLSRISKKAAPL
jgi:hypothetical protein